MILTPYSHLIFLVGEITLLIIFGIIICGFILLILTAHAIRSGKLLFPRFMRSGLLFLEGLMRGLFRLFGFEDQDLLWIVIKLQNTLNKAAFKVTPVSSRAIFVPHCLRSNTCPANLHDEGLKCRLCGRCSIGEVITNLEGLGYKVFIIPGSSFIKRMIKRYHPAAIIGIGCLLEVKEGLDMGGQINVITMGVVNKTDGCVETQADWEQVYKIALLGIDPEKIPEDLKKYLD